MIGYFEDCGRKAGDGGGRWHEAAAVQGHGGAQLSLALHLLSGSGGLRADQREAVGWLELAAAQGVREAMRQLWLLEKSGDVRVCGRVMRCWGKQYCNVLSGVCSSCKTSAVMCQFK
jgi:hypothetical protein